MKNSNLKILILISTFGVLNANASNTSQLSPANQTTNKDSTDLVPFNGILLAPTQNSSSTSRTITTGSIKFSGKCGSSSNSILTSAPTAFLCDKGVESSVSTTSTSGGGANYAWSCTGTNGKVSSCNATLRVVAACGSSNGGSYTSAPSSGLCSSGNASGVSVSGSSYSWTCSGNYGADASCSATYYSPQPPSDPFYPISGSTFTSTVTILICDPSDSDFWTYPGNVPYSTRMLLIGTYRDIPNHVGRCPEKSGYAYWLDLVNKFKNQNPSMSYDDVYTIMLKPAVIYAGNMGGSQQAAADQECQNAANAKFGYGKVSARYKPYSGNKCVVN